MGQHCVTLLGQRWDSARTALGDLARLALRDSAGTALCDSARPALRDLAKLALRDLTRWLATQWRVSLADGAAARRAGCRGGASCWLAEARWLAGTAVQNATLLGQCYVRRRLCER